MQTQPYEVLKTRYVPKVTKSRAGVSYTKYVLATEKGSVPPGTRNRLGRRKLVAIQRSAKWRKYLLSEIAKNKRFENPTLLDKVKNTLGL